MVLEKSHKRRFFVAACCVWLLFGGLLFRLVQTQWYFHNFYREEAEKQHRTRVRLYAHRGMILDREGRALAISTAVDSVAADPRLIQDRAATAQALAGILQVDYVDILTKLENDRTHFALIKRKVSREEADRVMKLKLPGVSLSPEEKRVYPLGSAGSHVIGFVDVDNRGLAGIEMLFDKCLAGTDGYQYVSRDARKKSISSPGLDYKPPRHGYTVVLSMDTVIQQIVEEELDNAVRQHNPKGAVAIAMSPQTGEVLGMTNRPTFDPNERYFVRTEEQAKLEADVRRNRAITDPFEPGSTFKPVVFLAALEQQLLRVDEVIDCHNGLYRAGRRALHDGHPYGRITAAQVLIHSSNIGMFQIGQRLGRRGLMNCLEQFGFGQVLGIELPAEDPGIVQKRWTEYTTGSVPMGQEIAVTPLQLVTAYTVMANGGNLYKPRIVRGVADSTGTKMLRLFPTPCKIRRIASSENTVKKLTPILTGVVDEGTGTKAKVPGYTTAGKTGTAQKITKEGPTGKHVSSFVAYAPASDPKIVVLVLMDECRNGAYYGGTVAAPAAGQIIYRTLKYWRIPPDAPEQRAETEKKDKVG